MTRPGYKKCKTCGRRKPVEQFYSDCRGRLKAHCKKCYNAARSKTGRSQPRRPIIDGKRQCRGCGQWLPATPEHFHRKAYDSGLHTQCKQCRGEEHKRWQQRTKDTGRQHIQR